MELSSAVEIAIKQNKEKNPHPLPSALQREVSCAVHVGQTQALPFFSLEVGEFLGLCQSGDMLWFPTRPQ